LETDDLATAIARDSEGGGSVGVWDNSRDKWISEDEEEG
jgi:hypothetical protein